MSRGRGSRGRGQGVVPVFYPNMFRSLEEQNRFTTEFDSKKVSVEKYVVVADLERFAVEERFRNLGWLPILFPVRDCFPNLVKYFYCNLRVHDIEGPNFYLSSLVKGVHIELNAEILSGILGIPNEGMETYCGPKTGMEDFLGDFYYEVRNSLVIDPAKVKVKESDLKPKPRVYSRITSLNILPRGGHFDELQPLQLLVTYSIVTGYQLNLPYIILRTMASIALGASGNLPYGRLLTKVFRQFGVHTAGEVVDGWRQAPFNATSIAKMTPLGDYRGSDEEAEDVPATPIDDDEEEDAPAADTPVHGDNAQMEDIVPPAPTDPFGASSSSAPPGQMDWGPLFSRFDALERHMSRGFDTMERRFIGLSDQVADIASRQTRLEDQFGTLSLRFGPRAPPPPVDSDDDDE